MEPVEGHSLLQAAPPFDALHLLTAGRVSEGKPTLSLRTDSRVKQSREMMAESETASVSDHLAVTASFVIANRFPSEAIPRKIIPGEGVGKNRNPP
jgi:hypothetical protein